VNKIHTIFEFAESTIELTVELTVEHTVEHTIRSDEHTDNMSCGVEAPPTGISIEYRYAATVLSNAHNIDNNDSHDSRFHPMGIPYVARPETPLRICVNRWEFPPAFKTCHLNILIGWKWLAIPIDRESLYCVVKIPEITELYQIGAMVVRVDNSQPAGSPATGCTRTSPNGSEIRLLYSLCNDDKGPYVHTRCAK